MLNHTYTSVKNANLVDCGKKQHIPSQPILLLKENFLSEFRTDLEKKKVLVNLGIVTDLLLEWEYIKGDISKNEALMKEFDIRTNYISKIDGLEKSIIEGLISLEETAALGEEEQNEKIKVLEKHAQQAINNIDSLKLHLLGEIKLVKTDVKKLFECVKELYEKLNSINNLIQVSNRKNNAITIIDSNQLEEGETPGLYVKDFSEEIIKSSENINQLLNDVETIQNNLETFVTKEELGGEDFNFVNQKDFDDYTLETNDKITNIELELSNTVKTGEDGHVDTLYVNTISKNNDEGNIKITDSFEVTEGIPLDVRFVVKDLNQLYSLKPLVCYPGMGVIVSSQSSLYILREPFDGIINEDYIKNPNSWKCPEDLLIEILTQEEYDKKVEENNINPNMFYYIHEEVVDEPIRENFDTEEEYVEALNKWLRVLQQKYMSAVWGQEIEDLVASKASNEAIKSLENSIIELTKTINYIQGGTSEINLNSLNKQIIQNSDDINDLQSTTEEISSDLFNLNKDIKDNYVTKKSITEDDLTTEYIFVKKTQFEDYKNEHSKQISESITTQELKSNSIIINNNTISSEETGLLLNNEQLALQKDVPIINLVDNDTFNEYETLDDNIYYYIYDDDNRYVLDSEFTKYKTNQSSTINQLNESITTNNNSIGNLDLLLTDNKFSLVVSINELFSKISNLENILKQQ